MFDNLWLSVDWFGGRKLEMWYESILPQLGWKSVVRPNRWNKEVGESVFWLKRADAEAEELLLKHIG